MTLFWCACVVAMSAAMASSMNTAMATSPMLQAMKVDEEKRLEKSAASNAKLTILAEEVERMSAVFEEANRAREEQRKIMDEMHQDLLRRIQMTRDYMTQEAKRLGDTTKSFTAKFEHELNSMKDELITMLKKKIAEVNHSLAGLETRSKELERAIEQEREDRIVQTEEVLGPIRNRVDRIMGELHAETKTRQGREQEIMKQLLDAAERLNNDVDAEKFTREQLYMSFKLMSERERQNLEDRQVQTRQDTDVNLRGIREELEKEVDSRIENQDGIVDNVTVFIKRFQENIKEDI